MGEEGREKVRLIFPSPLPPLLSLGGKLSRRDIQSNYQIIIYLLFLYKYTQTLCISVVNYDSFAYLVIMVIYLASYSIKNKMKRP